MTAMVQKGGEDPSCHSLTNSNFPRVFTREHKQSKAPGKAQKFKFPFLCAKKKGGELINGSISDRMHLTI